MENEKEKENTTNSILNEEFFNTIRLSKKINAKIKKINEITDYFQKTPNYIDILDIKKKLPDLFSLLLINLNENNNNYVLAQMDLILTLGKTINKEETFRNFIKQSLPKLFDKFYLGNPKINDNLIEMFDQFISFKILSIKDYYQYIENIPLEEEDNYRINIINFLYKQINNDETVLLNNIPKSLNDLIKRLINDNESDISESASKILNVLINRDVESNKKNEQGKNENENEDSNNKKIEDNKNDQLENEKKDNDINVDNKGSELTNKFVQRIVGAIKKEVGDDDELLMKKNEEEKNESSQDYGKIVNENNINISSNEEENKINDEKNKNETEINNNSNDNAIKEQNVEGKNDNIVNQDIKNDNKNEERKEEIIKDNIENKIELKNDEGNKNEEKKEEKEQEIITDKKVEQIEEKINEEKKEEINEEKKAEMIDETKMDSNEEIKKEKLEQNLGKEIEIKKEEKSEEKKGEGISVEYKKEEKCPENPTEEKKLKKNEEIEIEEKCLENLIEEKKEETTMKEIEEKIDEIKMKNKEPQKEQNKEYQKEEKQEEVNVQIEQVEEKKSEETKNNPETEKQMMPEINNIENKTKETIKENIIEQAKTEEKKDDNKNDEKKDMEIKGSSDSNNIDKVNQEENKNNDNENKKIEEKKENLEEKKNEKGNKVKKEGAVKRTGIKSQISKFRKNLGKNKKKGDGFEFELVEKKKDGNIEKSEIIPEEKENNSPITQKKEDTQEKIKKESIITEKEKVNIEKQPITEKEKDNIEKQSIKEETKVLELSKKEEIKKEDKEEKPKEELKNEVKEKKPKEEKQEEEIRIEKKAETKKEKEEEKPKEEIIKEEPIKNINNDIEKSESEPKKSIVAVNQQSLNEFEKKLQLALEQEGKEGLLKNNNENLTDSNPPPVKQKKEDPKFDDIKSVLGKEIIDSLFSPKWEVKKHGFELINEFINNKPQNSYNISDLIEYMKLKLKNYKETNFNINREAINIYINMIKKKILSKDLLIPIILAYHEKLADIKLKDNLTELIKNSFDIIEPNNILKQIISKISKKNNAKLLIEYSIFFGNVVEEYDVKDLPNKDIIDFCKIMANNSNPQVRTSAISLLCILYKYLGKDVKTLTRDIKESTLKLIDAELDKVQVIDPKDSAGKKKKVASTAGAEGKSGGAGGGAGGDLIPPQDVSKKITAAMIKELNGKWAEKKKACEDIEKVLTAANMRILPNGLNNIMTNIKKKLSDSNKNFVKMMVSLLSKFIEALKQGFKQWTKPIALALIPNLADKNQLMRNECQNCFDKWVEFTGFDSLVVHFPQFLKTDNVEMRIEIMNFFIKYKDKFNKSTGELVYKEMINPLLICLQDRSSNVRNAAEDIIKSSLSFIPINNYYKKSEDFKPAITKTLKQILDKIKIEMENSPSQSENNATESEDANQKQPVNAEQNNTNNKSIEAQNNTNLKKNLNQIQKKNDESTNNIANTNQKTRIKTASKKNSIQLNETPVTTESGVDDSEKNDSSNNLEDQLGNYNTVSNFGKTAKKPEKDKEKDKSKKNAINVKRAKPKRKLSEDDLVNPLSTTMNKQMPASSVSHLASNSTILKKNDKRSFQKNIPQAQKTSAVFLMNVKVIPNKAKRFDKDKRTKFSLETVSKDYFNKLKDQCKGLFVEDFSKKIFSDDFRKQVEAFKEMKSQIDKKINIPIYFDNLDLILKIIGIKIMNNLNPTLMKNLFEFLDSLHLVLSENKYKLNEIESNIIINTLIDKLSLNNNTLREHLILLLNKYIELMDTNKIMVTVINVALNKNSKIKSDILDLIIDLTMNEKLNISTKIYAKLLCRFLPCIENVIRSKTLTLFREIYSKIGNELWSMIEISEKDKEFLEENLCMENEEEEEEEEDELNPEEQEKEQEQEQENDTNKINENEQAKNNNNKNEIKEKNNNNNAHDNNSNIFPNQTGPLTKEDLLETLDNLLSEDQSEKLNTIIIIHEIVCGKFSQNKECLISNVDKIISTFKTVSHQLFFVKDLNSIPIKYAKYVSIVLCKLASNKELISHLSYEVLLDLSRELLKYLLINGLDKIGENQEGNIIFKSINSTMLRVLENCNTTLVITVLLELLKEFHEKDDKNLISLTIKCLLKTTHNLSENINNIQIDRILLQIHLLLLNLQRNNPDMNIKTPNNTLIINTVKNIVGDFVKLKKEKILEDYSKSVKNHQLNDKYLLKWIKVALEKV